MMSVVTETEDLLLLRMRPRQPLARLASSARIIILGAFLLIFLSMTTFYSGLIPQIGFFVFILFVLVAQWCTQTISLERPQRRMTISTVIFKLRFSTRTIPFQDIQALSVWAQLDQNKKTTRHTLALKVHGDLFPLIVDHSQDPDPIQRLAELFQRMTGLAVERVSLPPIEKMSRRDWWRKQMRPSGDSAF
jgi:hypothetical protein